MSTVDVQEVVKFLQSIAPFGQLENTNLRSVAAVLDVIYVRKGERLTIGGERAEVSIFDGLYIIRRGAFEILSIDNALVDKLADGECFGIFSVLPPIKSSTIRPTTVMPAREHEIEQQQPDQFVAIALEDSLLFRFPKSNFQALAIEDAHFATFFANTGAKRLDKLSLSRQSAASNVIRDTVKDSAQHILPQQHENIDHPALQLSLPVMHIMSSRLVTATAETSIYQATITMTDARVSSILVVENSKLMGIVTDRDLRSRVLAKGLSPSQPVATIMTRVPITLTSSALNINAQLLMSENNVHHLPIVDNDYVPVGIITVTDVLRHQQMSPLLMVSEINRQQSVTGLAKVCARLPQLVVNLVLADINPADMGEVLATITDNLTRRLITLALDDLGAAPMPFNFLVFGSQARKDQSLGSDQDNGLMLERMPNDIEQQYFQQLAKFICDGLNECGVPYCPGNIMSTNPEWCLTQNQWQQKFNHWIDSSSPASLLNASIFFDIRNVYGPAQPVDDLTKLLQQRAKGNSIFLATLTRNAVNVRPPLGFFRDFVLEHTGEHKNKLDLKHQALSLINDIARLYSFATSRYQNSTMQRLQWISDEGLLSSDYVKNLQDAWEYLSELRLYLQQVSWQKNGTASAYLDPSSLSPLGRKHLKSTFKTILEVQNSAQHRFAKGLH